MKVQIDKRTKQKPRGIPLQSNSKANSSSSQLNTAEL